MVIGIIGGGASGMAAALTAAKNKENKVILLERQARLGRKLQATGNGRCNLTNLNSGLSHYHGQCPEFADYALAQTTPEKTISWFSDLGLVCVAEPSGRVYPYSDQANSVVDVLRLSLEQDNIEIFTGFEVKKGRKAEHKFELSDGERTVSCDKLIVACGGLAGTKLGGSMSGYQLLRKFGHRCGRLRPALVQLKTVWGGIAALKGVRANAHTQIFRDGVRFSESTGEVQFTDYGLSGPVIFEISRDVCQDSGDWICRLDFLPQWDENTLLAYLTKRLNHRLTTDDLLTGILHNRLGRVLTKAAGIRGNQSCAHITQEELRYLCHCVKSFDIPLSEPLGMDSAQVTAGGILTEDFSPETMESRLVDGLYACGEVLDIDGDCGGYNLQWAFSSGILAGCHAGKVML